MDPAKKQNILAVLGALCGVIFCALFLISEDPSDDSIEIAPKEAFVPLVDPNQAPIDIREDVLLGFKIFNDPQKYASEYAGDRITCNNCHIAGGNTVGGQGGGIPLVGVSFVYPQYSPRDKRTISLAERVNNCFMRSLNGNPLPLDSPKMVAIIRYLDWISTPVKGEKDYPWVGLPDFKVDHKPDPVKGKQLYLEHCAICHREDGDGSVEDSIPPVFGPNSYNDGAGLNRVDLMSAFIHLNMPYQQPFMTIEESLDIAEYLHEQARPKFIPPGK